MCGRWDGIEPRPPLAPQDAQGAKSELACARNWQAGTHTAEEYRRIGAASSVSAASPLLIATGKEVSCFRGVGT